MQQEPREEDLASLVAMCPRSTLDKFVVTNILAAKPCQRAELARLVTAAVRADSSLRPKSWSCLPLVDWLPEVLLIEVLQHIDAQSMAAFATLCRNARSCVSSAIPRRVAALGLQLPTAGASLTRRLWFAERVGRAGIAWHVLEEPWGGCAPLNQGEQVPYSGFILWQRQSGLVLGCNRDSNGWIDVTVAGAPGSLSDCYEASFTQMEYFEDHGLNELALSLGSHQAVQSIPLIDYLHMRQPNFEGHFHEEDRSHPDWGFAVHDDGRVVLRNSDDFMDEDDADGSHEALTDLLKTAKAPQDRFLDAEGMDCFDDKGGLRLRYTANAVRAELDQRAQQAE